VLGDRERLPVHDLQGLEDPVARGEPVVQRRDGDRFILKCAVQPDVHGYSFQPETPYAEGLPEPAATPVSDRLMTTGGPTGDPRFCTGPQVR
jgi:hypothetical protein